MLFAPELRRASNSCRREDILEDSTQFLSTLIRKRLSVGAVMRSCLLIDILQQYNQIDEHENIKESKKKGSTEANECEYVKYLQTGQRPAAELRQLDNRHSRHIR